MSGTNVFLLMSVPGSKGVSDDRQAREKAFDKANSIASGYGSPCDKFEIPTLKVVSVKNSKCCAESLQCQASGPSMLTSLTTAQGTLDALMVLSDELDKFDKHADVALRRITRAWSSEISDDSFAATPDQLKVEMGVGEGNHNSI